MNGVRKMIYGFMKLEDDTEVTHTEMRSDGSVKVYFEKPVFKGFNSVECTLPQYLWEKNKGFSDEELQHLKHYLKSVSHIIIELSQTGGFGHASGL